MAELREREPLLPRAPPPPELPLAVGCVSAGTTVALPPSSMGAAAGEESSPDVFSGSGIKSGLSLSRWWTAFLHLLQTDELVGKK